MIKFLIKHKLMILNDQISYKNVILKDFMHK